MMWAALKTRGELGGGLAATGSTRVKRGDELRRDLDLA
jgi:hypothetical protein